MNVNGEKLEQILERVIYEITRQPVSVAILGKEISVNLAGLRFHFEMFEMEE